MNRPMTLEKLEQLPESLVIRPELASDDTLAMVLASLGHANPGMRASALHALAAMNRANLSLRRDEHVNATMKMLADGDPLVRAAALDAWVSLLWAGGGRSLDHNLPREELLRMSPSGPEGTCEFAMLALAALLYTDRPDDLSKWTLPGPAVAVFADDVALGRTRRALEDVDHMVRTHAIWAMGLCVKCRPERATPENLGRVLALFRSNPECRNYRRVALCVLPQFLEANPDLATAQVIGEVEGALRGGGIIERGFALEPLTALIGIQPALATPDLADAVIDMDTRGWDRPASDHRMACWVLARLVAANPALATERALRRLVDLRGVEHRASIQRACMWFVRADASCFSPANLAVVLEYLHAATSEVRQFGIFVLARFIEAHPACADEATFSLILRSMDDIRITVLSTVPWFINADSRFADERSLNLAMSGLVDNDAAARETALETVAALVRANDELVTADRLALLCDGLKDPVAKVRLAALGAIRAFVEMCPSLATGENALRIMPLGVDPDWTVQREWRWVMSHLWSWECSVVRRNVDALWEARRARSTGDRSDHVRHRVALVRRGCCGPVSVAPEGELT